MLKSTHDPWVVRRFHKGSNTDMDAEGVPDGFARDMFNMRSTSVDGNTGAAEKIKGYVEIHGDEGAPGSYRAIGACVAGGRNVVFWASPVPGENPIIRVDGVTMASSPNIPYTWDRPLQLAVKDVLDGIVFPVDGNAPPLFWDIGDMVTQYGLGALTYFAAYTIADNSIGMMAPPHFPQLVSLDNVGGTGGLLPGLYAYAIRWVTAAGDKTNIGPFSPLIGVPYNLDVNGVPTSVLPGTRNYGGPATTIATPYAIHLEFRVDNYAGFDRLEVIRVRFNDGAGLLGAGVVEIVGRIDVANNQFSIEQFVDPGDSITPELIPDDEEIIQQLVINAPKGVEYMDNRLLYANFTTDPQVIEPTFREVGGEKVFPFTSKVTTRIGSTEVPGTYSDPLNFAYKRSLQRGEKYGFAIAPWNGLNGTMAAIPIPGAEDYQMPNRRDEKAGDSLVYSDDPCTACNVDHVVTGTFEAITQGEARKTDIISTANISPHTQRAFASWNSFTAVPPSNTSFVNAGGNVQDIGYAPLNPTGNNDDQLPPNWNYVVNNMVMVGTNGAPAFLPYQPEGFAPVPQTLGIGIYGVEDIPPYVNAFTVARTQPAGRVVMQGIFHYQLQEAAAWPDPCGKLINGGIFFSPDMLNGLVEQSVIYDIIANPTSYRLQMVSPFGFYSEVFSHHEDTVATSGGISFAEGQFMDMISHARIIHDNGEINPFDTVAMGVGNYVDFGRWRSTATTSTDPVVGTSFFHQPGNNGNSLLTIDNATIGLASPRSQFLHLGLDNYCYMETSAGSSDLNMDPNSTQVRRFHEPFYVANIVRVGATVPSGGIVKYVPTSTTIMMESCVGVYNGSIGGLQSFRLVGERRDDCYGWLSSDFRYVYVDGERYVCYTNNTYLLNPVNLAAALFDIINYQQWIDPLGNAVRGIFTFDTNTNSVQIGAFQVPADGARITVRYDSTAPIRAHGGDVTIDTALHCPIDNQGVSDQLPTSTSGFKLSGVPMPFGGFISDPRYMILEEGNSGSGTTEENIVLLMRSLRQWVILFDCECRGPLSFATNLLSVGTPADQDQFYGAVNYIMRPNKVAISGSAVDNGLYADYETSYPGEISSGLVLRGGFRFLQKLNLDYAHRERISFASVPSVGYEEKTDFPTGVVWSAKSDPLQVDLPGLRTFSSQNLKVIDENTGEIKTIYALNGGGQFNLYGRTHGGTFKLLTNKNVLVGASGEVIGTQATDVFISDRSEIWLSRSIGSPDGYWVLGARGSALAGSGYADSAFWADRRAAYRQVGDQIIDISTGRYWNNLSDLLVGGPDNGIYSPYSTGFFDPIHQEWWIIPFRYTQAGPGSLVGRRKLYAYSCQTGEWQGEYEYDQDRFLSNGASNFGFTQRKDYQLDLGYTFDGEEYESWVESIYSKPDAMRKEAVRFRENSNVSPTRIEIYDEDHVLMTFTDAATFGQYWIKFIDGYEQNVSRNAASYDFERKRPQSRLFFKRTLHEGAEAFVLNDSQLQLHVVK